MNSKPFQSLNSSSSSLKSLFCLPSHLTMWESFKKKKLKKKIKHIIISSASLPTFRHHCNSASDVNIWAWFSFNGFNNKIQSNVNIGLVCQYVLFVKSMMSTHFNTEAFEGENNKQKGLKRSTMMSDRNVFKGEIVCMILLCHHWAWTRAPAPWPYPNPLGPKFLA